MVGQYLILIPIALTKRDKSILEREDYEKWFEMRGFSDDDESIPQMFQMEFHLKLLLMIWMMMNFKNIFKQKEGLKFLEKYHTSKGLPVGSYDKLVDDPFEEWKKSERV